MEHQQKKRNIDRRGWNIDRRYYKSDSGHPPFIIIRDLRQYAMVTRHYTII
ncbi:hypothetical protein J2Z82_000328 [Virgibacillus litoralis]|uniref:Uncharacterized protein n=1 Tax=Virgibacillus litoralis TaxID=578221 RepID=A0ABS4H919_9BACI|nr:hypothetical protein [Virgibacillus litoralis]